jgi:hypothetical protein
MPIPKSFIEDALLKYNYFPRQKRDKSELPPSFSSNKFTPTLAKKLISSKQRDKYIGWDSVTYKSTRFNGVSRIVSIPHPIAQAHLALFIADRWSDLEFTANNTRSLIRPRKHKDGRLIIMDYEANLSKLRRQHELSFGKRFRVHTDISNCFPSLYSHAVAWATVGFSHAKRNQNKKNAWFNKLDERIRWCKRNETNGVAIGPGTSNVVIEAVLAKVDEVLSGTHGFSFVRYIDDYTAYCSEETEAQRFIRVLSNELEKYKFQLNIKKTKVDRLPEPITESWVAQLAVTAPKKRKKRALTIYEVSAYLGAAQNLARAEPDGSVLKYALTTLLAGNLRPNAEEFLLDEMLVLSFHYPIMIPKLGDLLRRAKARPFATIGKDYESKLNELLIEHAINQRSDSMCWLLHYTFKMGYAVSARAGKKVLDTRDCAAIVALYGAGSAGQQTKIVDFAKALDPNDLYCLDSYWLLIYELFATKKMSNPYSQQENAFELMKKAKLRFFQIGKKW